MVVTCGQCKKAFLLPDAKIKPTGTRVRCKKCGNEFVVVPPAAAAAEAPPPPPPPLPPPAPEEGDAAPQGLAVEEAAPEPPSEPERDFKMETTGSGFLVEAENTYEVTFSSGPEPSRPPVRPTTPRPPAQAGGGGGAAGTGDMQIDFGVVDQLPASGPLPPPVPEMAAPSAPAPPVPKPPAPAADGLALEDFALEEPPPLPGTPAAPPPDEPMGAIPEATSGGGDPLAGLDLDFALDEKALGGSPQALPAAPPPTDEPAPTGFEPTSFSPPPAPPIPPPMPPPLASPPPAASSPLDLKAEFEALGRSSLVKGNLDEIASPEPLAPPISPPRPQAAAAAPGTTPAERESVRPKLMERLEREPKEPVSVPSVELRPHASVAAAAWALFAVAVLGVGGLWLRPLFGEGSEADEVSGPAAAFAALAGLRPATVDMGEGIQGVRGRAYRNVYDEAMFLVTGWAPREQAARQVLRVTFLDENGWKMGEVAARWVPEIPPREFAILRLTELEAAVENLQAGREATRETVPFVAVLPAVERTPRSFTVRWVGPAREPPESPSPPD